MPPVTLGGPRNLPGTIPEPNGACVPNRSPFRWNVATRPAPGRREPSLRPAPPPRRRPSRPESLRATTVTVTAPAARLAMLGPVTVLTVRGGHSPVLLSALARFLPCLPCRRIVGGWREVRLPWPGVRAPAEALPRTDRAGQAQEQRSREDGAADPPPRSLAALDTGSRVAGVQTSSTAECKDPGDLMNRPLGTRPFFPHCCRLDFLIFLAFSFSCDPLGSECVAFPQRSYSSTIDPHLIGSIKK